MKKTFALLLVALFLVGCASSATSGSGSGNALGFAGNASASHYRLLSDPATIRELDWAQPPNALHVKGRMTTAGFEPMGQVEGRGGLCTDGKDFVSLSDGRFHAAGDSPNGSYVTGCKTATGGFKPSTREILSAQ